MEDEGFWCPTLVDNWRSFLSRGVPNDGALHHRRAFISNLGYSLQYLQFLDYQIRKVNLHATVYTHTLKSFVVAGMGIIEAISWYLLKRKGWNRKHDWEQIAELQSQPYRDGDDELRVVNKIEKKLSAPTEIEMSLQWMIRRVEKKKLLGMDGQVYRDLNYLRGLRNKVHLHVVQHDSDTDWNAFSNNELKLMKKALFGVFTSEIFDPTDRHKEWLDFLRVEESTEELVEDIPF